MGRVQWVASWGGSISVRSTTLRRTSAGRGGVPGLRVWPSTPSCTNRSCQYQTTGLHLPDRRMIFDVPQPAKIILATADATVTVTPVRISLDSYAAPTLGILCLAQSTRLQRASFPHLKFIERESTLPNRP